MYKCLWSVSARDCITYLCNHEADKLGRCAEVDVVTSNDTEHQSADEKPLNLNPSPSQYLDEVNGEKVAGNQAGNGNDQVSVRGPQ